MGASRLLAMKPGFQWHKATGEPPETTSIAKPLDVPPAAPDPLERYLWANKKTGVRTCAIRRFRGPWHWGKRMFAPVRSRKPYRVAPANGE